MVLAKVVNGVSYGFHKADVSASDEITLKFVGNAGQTLTDLAVICANATYTVDADAQDELINNRKSSNSSILGKIYGYFFNN